MLPFKIKYILTFVTCFLTLSYQCAFSQTADYTLGTNLPYNLLFNSLTESPEYDEDFDYQKLKTIHILNLHKDNTIKEKQNKIKVIHRPFIYKIVNKVVVYKSRYQMILYKNDEIIKTYNIALGKNPKGHKEYEGDKRTPEGTYTLDYIKLNSNYYKAFHISYPNIKDIQHAQSIGKKPGGMIMIHGQPNDIKKRKDYIPGLQASNWTDGCIALLNEDMDEFINYVSPGTIITIKP